MQGVFITFEGADGSGKTTQLKLLADYLTGKGFTVNVTREPGGTPLGDALRALLLDARYSGMDARAEALLYMAARAQHVAERIRPALTRGEIVLSDRYADSTIVYQGVARKLAHQLLVDLNNFATGGLEPDLTLLLDCEPSHLALRMRGRGTSDRIEQESAAFHDRVRQGFRQLHALQPERIRLIDAAGTVAEVHQQIVHVISEFFVKEGLL